MTIPPDKSPDSISAGKSVEPTGKTIPSGKTPEGFESHMQSKQVPASQVGGPTPMEMTRTQPIAVGTPTFDSLTQQSRLTQDTLGTIEKQLNDRNLKLKRSQSHLVKQKLGDANQYLHAAASKLGTQPLEEKSTAGMSGVTKFIAMVNHGQNQLVSVQEQIAQMSKNKGSMSPADMLSVQVKMGLAQQEVEYTSTLLGKVIQSITQIINTQL